VQIRIEKWAGRKRKAKARKGIRGWVGRTGAAPWSGINSFRGKELTTNFLNLYDRRYYYNI
jgi:hypothetical protein